MFHAISNFFIEVKAELKKVTWPTRQETVNYTLIVIAVSAAVAAFLGSLDFVLTFLVNTFII